MRQFFCLFGMLMLLPWGPVAALQPHEMLEDPALEARARVVSKELRCVVCQNQSIDDSDAGLAQKMRIQVRERILAGDSNQDVIDYMVSRYGDFVLLNPPMKTKTLVLWYGPLAMVLLGLIGVVLYYRSRMRTALTGPAVVPLSADEQARLAALLDEEKDKRI